MRLQLYDYCGNSLCFYTAQSVIFLTSYCVSPTDLYIQ